MKKAALALLLAIALPARADLADKMERLVGYTIVDSKTIEGWRDGRERGDDFEGCERDRVIVFRDGTSLTCDEHNHTHDHHPTAIILAKGSQFRGISLVDVKMVVGDEVFDMKSR